ncbi:hypothetical protein SAY86_007653 [Trapa natans]|uniref:Gnk2-homologous domain-containing protein n=1 Tax=Trapa natans TaxID=22666 RepID=A0AAN7LEW6_TRANT|nr:hypothetical protein SAY86_007653 [Trapa natans]
MRAPLRVQGNKLWNETSITLPIYRAPLTNSDLSRPTTMDNNLLILTLLLLILSSWWSSVSSSLPYRPFLLGTADPLFHFCGSTGNFTANSTYQENLSSLLRSFSSKNSLRVTNGFSSLSSGRSPDQVNGIALCRGDLALSHCQTCIGNASLEITQLCPTQKESVVYYETCFLRYSNQYILGLPAGNSDIINLWNVNNATSVTEFTRVLMELMNSLKNLAAAGNSTLKFAAANRTGPDSYTIYGLTQLAPLASPSVSPPRPATNTTEPPPSHEGKSSSTTPIIIIIAVVSGVALFILLISIFCFCQRNQRKPSQNVESVEKLERKGSAEYHRSSTGLWANIRDTEMHSCRTAVRPGECNGQTNYGFSGDDAQ